MADRTFSTRAGFEITGAAEVTYTITDAEQDDPVLRWLLDAYDHFTNERTFTMVHEGLVVRRLSHLRRKPSQLTTNQLRLRWHQAHADWEHAKVVEQALFDELESRGQTP